MICKCTLTLELVECQIVALVVVVVVSLFCHPIDGTTGGSVPSLSRRRNGDSTAGARRESSKVHIHQQLALLESLHTL